MQVRRNGAASLEIYILRHSEEQGDIFIGTWNTVRKFINTYRTKITRTIVHVHGKVQTLSHRYAR
jgi:hypothetical protein